MMNASIYLMAGFPGCGKSTLAKRMKKTFSAAYLSSDTLREKIFHSARYDKQGDASVSSQRDEIYQLIGKEALKKINKGKKVIIDATNLEDEKREKILGVLLSKVLPQDICFVCVKTPYAEIYERWKQWDQATDDSDESPFQAWQRVYQIFAEKEKQGLLSWPSYPNIPSIAAEKMYAYLDQQP